MIIQKNSSQSATPPLQLAEKLINASWTFEPKYLQGESLH